MLGRVELFEYNELASTQEFARLNYASLGIKRDALGVVFARRQTNGHGTKNRVWDSRVGNVYLTFIVPNLHLYAGYLHNIPQLASLSILELMHELAVPAEFKWINDIYVNNSKIAGVLAESVNNSLLIGMGINVNNAPPGFTAIKEIIGKDTELYDVLRIVTARMQHNLLHLIDKGFGSIAAKLLDYLMWKGMQVAVKERNVIVKGCLIGIDENGYLLLDTEQGLLHVKEGSLSLDVDKVIN